MTTEIIEETEINNIYDNIKELVINARSHYEKCVKCIKIRNGFLFYINYYVILKEKERVIIWK